MVVTIVFLMVTVEKGQAPTKAQNLTEFLKKIYWLVQDAPKRGTKLLELTAEDQEKKLSIIAE